MGALDQVEVGEAVCYYVKVWENAVEEDEQGHLSCCDDIPEELITIWHTSLSHNLNVTYEEKKLHDNLLSQNPQQHADLKE